MTDSTAPASPSSVGTAALRLLATGGMGFIGSNFVRHALRTRPGWAIINLDKLTYAGNPANLRDVEAGEDRTRYRHVRGDIADADLVSKLLAEGIDVVVNLAAESHVDRSILDAGPFLQTNVVGTGVLLEASRRAGVGHFVQVSTDEVYGPAPEGMNFTEEAPLLPSSPYAASKASADLLCLAFYRTYGFPAVIGRCTNNYGPYQYPEKFVPLVITRALEGEPIPIYGDGLQVRDWLHVQDHCEAICRLVEAGLPGQVYNIAGRNLISNLDLARNLLRLLGRPDSLLKFVRDRPGHDRRYSLDDTHLRAALGFTPAWTLDRGLEDTVAWYLEHPEWWGPIKRGEHRRFFDAWYSMR